MVEPSRNHDTGTGREQGGTAHRQANTSGTCSGAVKESQARLSRTMRATSRGSLLILTKTTSPASTVKWVSAPMGDA